MSLWHLSETHNIILCYRRLTADTAYGMSQIEI